MTIEWNARENRIKKNQLQYMDIFISFFVFVIIFLFYMHFTNHLKPGGDLETYEMDYTDNAHLQKVCDLKQPVLFQLPSSVSQFSLNLDVLPSVEKIHVKVKDTNDYYGKLTPNMERTIGYIYVPYPAYKVLTKSDPTSHYFSENNDELMEDTGLENRISKTFDPLLKPPYSLILQKKYDVCMGSMNVSLPLRYHTHFRNYYIVVKGKIHVKMTPFKNSPYLEPNDDYDNYEHYSTKNVWETQFEHVKFLEFDVFEGMVLYVPPYWWFSIKYSNDENTILCNCCYDGIISSLSQSPEWIKCYMQQRNTEQKYLKKTTVNEKMEEEETNEQTTTPATTTEDENKTPTP